MKKIILLLFLIASLSAFAERTFTFDAINSDCEAFFLGDSSSLRCIEADGTISTQQVTATVDGYNITIFLTDFFIDNGNIYFSFTDSYYTDPLDPLTYIEEDRYFSYNGTTVISLTSLPAKPILADQAEYSSSKYLLEKLLYNGTIWYSQLTRLADNKVAAIAYDFNSIYEFNSGVIFSQKTKIGSRDPGIFKYTDTHMSGPTRLTYGQNYAPIWIWQ